MPGKTELEELWAQLSLLTARVRRLEQEAGLDAPPRPEPVLGAPQPTNAPPPTSPIPPPPAPATPPPVPAFLPPSDRESNALENRIGKVWLNRIGIFAILVGVSYFIKYAFDNGWIGPAGRVALGLLAGIGLVLWSERFRNKGYVAFSYSLKAVGIGTLYLSLWGAYQLYHLVPSAAAFLLMVIVTASTIALALSQGAEILAAIALAGGFSTPILLSTGENHEIVLFSYVILLNLAILGMVTLKPWRRLLLGSFIGTGILYVGWFAQFYTKTQRGLTLFFTIVFGAIFAAIPLLTPLTKSRWHRGFSITLTLLPLLNAAALFLALFAMYDNQRLTLTWYTLVLAAVYLGLSSLLRRRAGNAPEAVRLLDLLHIAIAIAFITIAIPLKLETHWITIGWLAESAALLFVSIRTRSEFLRYFAAVILILGIFRLLAFDNFQVETLVFNARFASYLLAIAILGAIAAAGTLSAERKIEEIRIAGVSLNALALIALTLEASDYFARQMATWYQVHTRNTAELQQIYLARNFSYSAIWLGYGAGLMMFGFWKRSAFVRWQALVLIAFTIGKVFLYDVSELQQGYRILSFIALGAVLMAISYIYHRDWLKLSSPPPKNTEGRNAS